MNATHKVGRVEAPAPKYPGVSVRLTGRGRNSFSIAACCSRAAREAGVPGEEVAVFQAEAMAGDYDNLLRVCMRWFDVS